MKKLEEQLGYFFKNKELLKQALTRESAIQEKLPNAAKQSYQTLEFVGDAALKHVISRILFDKLQKDFTEGELHDYAKKLIANEDTLPQIADNIGLSQFIIKGKGETAITSKMKADALEAILGAISMDNQSQENLFYVIEQLWKPHLTTVFREAEEAKSRAKPQLTVTKISNNNNNQLANNSTKITMPISTKSGTELSIKAVGESMPNSIQLRPPSPRTQRMFSGIGGTFPADKFDKILSEVPDINRKNTGIAGDTALMALLRKEKLRENKEIPKIIALLKHGALWTVKNNRGETADDLAKKHDQQLILKLKNTI